MKTTTIFISILFIMSFLVQVECEDFYVDALNGSNENPGTSPDDAWKTITYRH